MKTALTIAMAAFLAACAGAAPRPQADVSGSRWQGYVLRNGLRAPVSLELRQGGGRLSAGDNAVPLEDVRVSDNTVHFALPGEGTFDGAVAGDTMAGSVDGPVKGSFALTRIDTAVRDADPYPNGP